MRRIVALSLFLLHIGLSLAADPPKDGPGVRFEDDLVAHLEGHWDLTRSMRGREVKNTVDAAWVLDHQFLEMHMRDVAIPAKYDAHVYIGWSNTDRHYVVHWIDVFGGHYSMRGYGVRSGDSIEFRFTDDAGRLGFVNTFNYNRPADEWTMRLENVATDGARSAFATDRLVRRAGSIAAPPNALK